MHHTWTNLKGYDPVYAPFSKTEFDNLPLWRQILERICRSALGLALLYFIEIYWKWELFPKKENQPRRRHQFKIDRAIVLLFGLLQILVALCLSYILAESWETAVITTLFAVLLPYCVWNWIMGFVTFQQHTHPKIAWFDKKEEWSFFLGQICCTAYVIFPFWINRLLHNIMEHTVHHVDPLIPLYNLPDNQNKLIEVYGDNITIVRWSISEFLKTLQVCKLYDYQTHRWMGFDGNYTSESCTNSTCNCSPSLRKSYSMDYNFQFLRYLIEKGGPDKDDYHNLDSWVLEFIENVKKGHFTKEYSQLLMRSLGDAASTETMQGFVFQKPHGYAGDYEIIDRIYTRYVSDKDHLRKWDDYLHDQAAVNAVRNRAYYFCKLIENFVAKYSSRKLEVLNIASGPGRDMLYFFENNPNALVNFDCIEQDPNAINHARELNIKHLEKINFIAKNALRFKSEKKYDLIWSAGLFDYFDDKRFVFMLKRLRSMMVVNGEMVIGNFSTKNPNRAYMELFEWHLHHRSPEGLIALAKTAGYETSELDVRMEESGVNLFLHIRPNTL